MVRFPFRSRTVLKKRNSAEKAEIPLLLYNNNNNFDQYQFMGNIKIQFGQRPHLTNMLDHC